MDQFFFVRVGFSSDSIEPRMKMEAVGLKGVLVLRLAGCDNGV